MAQVEFDHISRNGTIFRCAKLDLSQPIKYSDRPSDENRFLQDVAEVISFHCFHIWDNVHEFPGYDCVNFQRVSEEEQ